MAYVDDGSSTESEDCEPSGTAYSNYPSVTKSSPSTPLPTPLTEGVVESVGSINILDLLSTTQIPASAPVPTTNKPNDNFVIPRRPIPKPTNNTAPQQPTKSSTGGSTYRHRSRSPPRPVSRKPPPRDLCSQCRRELSDPVVRYPLPPVNDTRDCSCCGRKRMDRSRFGKKQWRRNENSKCRDCTAPMRSKASVRLSVQQQRDLDERRKTYARQDWSRERGSSWGTTRQEPGRSNQRTRTREQRSPPRRSLPEQLSYNAQKKQRKRQKRMEEMAEIDQNPPPPRSSRPPREAAQKAQEEWRGDPRMRHDGYAARHQQLEAAARSRRQGQH